MFYALLIVLCSIQSAHLYATFCNHTTPTLVLRSQARHADRQKWVGQANHINLYNQADWHGTWDAGVAYMNSFNNHDIAGYLFGSDIIDRKHLSDAVKDACSCNSSTILVQGSSVPNRNENAWLADYLYLGWQYDGAFSIQPEIKNVMVDLDLYVALTSVKPGMYMRFYGPLTWTKWSTKFRPHDASIMLTSTYDPKSIGYFTPSGTEEYLPSIAQYFAGEAPTTTNGVVFEGLRYARLSNQNRSKVGFADLRAELGYNFLEQDEYFLGFNIQAAAPTGNRRRAVYVMEPIIGNGHHWELGGGLTAHYGWKPNYYSTKRIGLYFDVNITHLFNAKEMRTFDLINGNNSRYMLASLFTYNVFNNGYGIPNSNTDLAGVVLPGLDSGGIVLGRKTLADAQFDYLYTPVANLSTLAVNVSIPVQADLVLMTYFKFGNVQWDIGYNFWAHNCEKIKPATCGSSCTTSLLDPAQQNTWALKGDSRMFGFFAKGEGNNPMPNVPQNMLVALSATQHTATIHSGLNALQEPTTTCSGLRNCGVDKSQFAVAGDDPTLLTYIPISAGALNNGSYQLKTSIQPIFLQPSDLAFVATSGLSNKVFTHISYTGYQHFDWKPYIGIGGSAEFASQWNCNACDNDSCDTQCTNGPQQFCTQSAISQWAVWIKSGFVF